MLPPTTSGSPVIGTYYSYNVAACKGTHDIVTKFEAQRYLIYTYLFLGDILSLDDSDEERDK